jgi:hypothetical protein
MVPKQRRAACSAQKDRRCDLRVRVLTNPGGNFRICRMISQIDALIRLAQRAKQALKGKLPKCSLIGSAVHNRALGMQRIRCA